jgi:hypothetical protein
MFATGGNDDADDGYGGEQAGAVEQQIRPRVLYNLMLLVEIFLVASTLDGHLAAPWAVVLTPVWLYLVVLAAIGVWVLARRVMAQWHGSGGAVTLATLLVLGAIVIVGALVFTFVVLGVRKLDAQQQLAHAGGGWATSDGTGYSWMQVFAPLAVLIVLRLLYSIFMFMSSDCNIVYLL